MTFKEIFKNFNNAKENKNIQLDMRKAFDNLLDDSKDYTLSDEELRENFKTLCDLIDSADSADFDCSDNLEKENTKKLKEKIEGIVEELKSKEPENYKEKLWDKMLRTYTDEELRRL